MTWKELTIEQQLNVLKKVYKKIQKVNNDEFSYVIKICENGYILEIEEVNDGNCFVNSLRCKTITECIEEVILSAEEACLSWYYTFPFDKNASLEYFVKYANKV